MAFALDKLINILLGGLMILLAFNPGIISQKPAVLEKLKRFKVLFLIGGIGIVVFNLLRIFIGA